MADIYDMSCDQLRKAVADIDISIAKLKDSLYRAMADFGPGRDMRIDTIQSFIKSLNAQKENYKWLLAECDYLDQFGQEFKDAPAPAPASDAGAGGGVSQAFLLAALGIGLLFIIRKRK